MPTVLIRQIACLLDRDDRLREGGLEKLGVVGRSLGSQAWTC